MTPIVYLHGDATLLSGGPKVVVHVCNDAGAWGRGFVLSVSAKWPVAEAAYRRMGVYSLGMIGDICVEPDVWVVNMIAQHGIRGTASGPCIRYDALRQCLTSVRNLALYREATVCMPRIGCGLAGGKWELVEPIIAETLSAADVPVCVYDL